MASFLVFIGGERKGDKALVGQIPFHLGWELFAIALWDRAVIKGDERGDLHETTRGKSKAKKILYVS